MSDGSYSYSYDNENRMVSASGWTYVYDGDGKRVKKANGSSGRLYWTGIGSEVLAESDLSGNLQAEYVFFNGKRIARRDLPSGDVHYYFFGSPGIGERGCQCLGCTRKVMVF